MKIILPSLVLFSIIAVLSGCQTFASVTKPKVTYDESIPIEQQAYLYIDKNMKVKEFDGEKVKWYNNSTVAIPPGNHTLICDFQYTSDNRTYWKYDITLSFEAKTGWTYRLNADTNLFLLSGVFEIIPSTANQYATIEDNETKLIFKRAGIYAGTVLVYIDEDKYLFPITKKEDVMVIVKNGRHTISSKLPIGAMSDSLEITAESKDIIIEIKPTTSFTRPKARVVTPEA